MKSAPNLHVVTWNIHKGIGTDRAYRLERIIETLAALDADVVCLQEVDRHVPRSAHDDQAHRLSEALGYPHAALGLNVSVKRGAYGNLTLSRLPLEDVHNVDLTVPPKKRRSALVTKVMVTPTEGWLLANVHLGLMHLERRVQVSRLLGHMFEGATPEQPLIIAGDWNEWGRRLVRSVMTAHHFEIAGLAQGPRAARTWPSGAPLVSLDRVLYREPLVCTAWEVVRNDVTRVASDHLPVSARLERPG